MDVSGVISGISTFFSSLFNLFVQPFIMVYHAVGLIGSGADIYIYASTQHLFPEIISTSFAFSLAAGFIKFIWRY